MKTLFCTYIDNDVLKYIETTSCTVVAITPEVCYKLDCLGYNYFIPEDFGFPKEVDIDTLYNEKKLPDIFSLSLAHTLRASNYWEVFITGYLSNDIGGTNVSVVDDRFPILKGLLFKHLYPER